MKAKTKVATLKQKSNLSTSHVWAILKVFIVLFIYLLSDSNNVREHHICRSLHLVWSSDGRTGRLMMGRSGVRFLAPLSADCGGWKGRWHKWAASLLLYPRAAVASKVACHKYEMNESLQCSALRKDCKSA